MAEGRNGYTNNQFKETQAGGKVKALCRRYLWGTCYKYTTCRHRHELVFEEMVKCLKFCHDYQNTSMCVRENCTYLHASREEEAHFKATGTMPRVLAERHAAIAAADPRTFGSQSQGMGMHMATLAPPPPPPLPPPAVTSAPPLPSSAPPITAGPPPAATVMPPPVPMPLPPPSGALPPPPVALPPPPPPALKAMPPPIPPPTIAVPSFPANVYTPTGFAAPPSRAPVFDTSRPPPPPPHHSVPEQNPTKRKMYHLPDAAAPIMKKATPSTCEDCRVRIESIDTEQKRIETFIGLEADRQLQYNNMLEAFLRKKSLALMLVQEDKKNALENYIEYGTKTGAPMSGGQGNQRVLGGDNTNMLLLELVGRLFASSSSGVYNSPNANPDETLALLRSIVAPNKGAVPATQESNEAMRRTISDILFEGNRTTVSRDFPVNRSTFSNGNGNHGTTSGAVRSRPHMPGPFPAQPAFPRAPNSNPYPGTCGPFPAQAARFSTPPTPFSQGATYTAHSAPYIAHSAPYSAQSAPYRPRLPPTYTQANGIPRAGGSMSYLTPPPSTSSYHSNSTNSGSSQKPYHNTYQ